MSALRLAAALSLLAAPAVAQEVSDCDWRARLDAIPEPWEAHTRTFANGNVRLTVTDTIEPAAGAFHLVLVSPPWDELGGRQCKVISLGGGVGFSGVFFGALSAGYDPAIGLMWDLPVQVYDGATGGFGNAMLSFTLNQSTGAIGAWLGPAD